jgi:L-cysteine:1D-myo-inositol 2-amino-2-deoxy-alpha-D-glucopyranoside ligase
MHQAMVRMDGEKMSKSLGNLVFVSDLLETHEPDAVRLAAVCHHYRDSWEWDDTVMPTAVDRLTAWRDATQSTGAGDSAATLDAVRRALDDDLDTPAAVAALDEAAARGEGVASGAALLGVALGAPLRA